MLLCLKPHALKRYVPLIFIYYSRHFYRTISIIILVHLCVDAFGQKKVPVVNQPLPYNGPFVINGDSKNPKTLDAFKGEYLILDLFTSRCIVCFQMMPKINQLQKDFKGKVRFLMIGAEDGQIATTYQKFEKKLGLVMDYTFDSVIFRRIKIKAPPTYIWINPDGKVVGVTGPEAVKASTINNFLKGNTIHSEYYTEPYAYDYLSPIYKAGNGGPDSNFLRRTIFGEWNAKMPMGLPNEVAYLGKNKVYNVLGVRKSGFYKLAYWGDLSWYYDDDRYKRVYPSPVFLDEKGQELPKVEKEVDYFYSDSYQGDRVPDIKRRLQWELKNYFEEEVEFVKRLMPCWIVRIAPEAKEKLKSKHKKYSGSYSHAGLEFNNTQMSQLMDKLCYNLKTDTVFVDETGIDFPIDIKIDALLTDQRDFFNALRKQGMSIDLEKREMEVMLIRPSRNAAMRKLF